MLWTKVIEWKIILTNKCILRVVFQQINYNSQTFGLHRQVNVKPRIYG